MAVPSEKSRNMALIIGISGATNSGKSTLTKKLVEYFNGSSSFCQDDYFLEIDSDKLEPVPHLNCVNWDVLSALDSARITTDIQKWLEKVSSSDTTSNQIQLLFVDGFLLFNYKPLSELFDMKYFLAVSKDVCEKRRNQRVYNPPDCPGYFEFVAWPCYLQNKAELEDQKDIVYLNGDDDMESNYKTILEMVLLEIKKKNVRLESTNS